MNIITLAQPVRARPWACYGLALLLTLLVAAGFTLAPLLRDFPFLLPVTGVTIVAFLGGVGPAILAAVLADLYVQYYVLGPTHSFALTWPSGYIGVTFYIFLCGIIIALMHGMFSANAALETSQAALRAFNDRLEHRVAERTATLIAAQQELRDTNQSLESRVAARVGDLQAANDEIQRFAYIVSHDLRAPLVNVLGFTSELEALRLDLGDFLKEVAAVAPQLVTTDRRLAIEEDLPEALGFIRSSTQKMDRLINAILKLSREGRRKLTPQTIDIAALVVLQGETLAQQLASKDATLVVEGDLPDVISDRLAIEQIFGNLIENAVKYLSPARPGRITVTGSTTGTTRRYDIADNGRGIVAQDLERIFELFRRSGEQDTQGEGIGLAYVRNLVRRLGGDVTVASTFGVGTVFTVTLPVALQASAHQAGAEA